eukprot:1810648-Alexandrium_andersonii.AAC.1
MGQPVSVGSAPRVIGGTEAEVAVYVRFDGAGVSAEHSHRGGAGAVAWSISRGVWHRVGSSSGR